MRPLFRTNAVRRETSPCSGLSRKVAITYSPSGKFEIGPRSTSNVSTPSPMNDGSTPNPRTGRVTPAPISPPTPIVASERNVARSTDVPRSASVTAPNCAVPSLGAPAVAESTGCVANRSRIHRKPKTSVMSAPTISAGTLTTRPTRMHATPMAKPIGQRLGAGT